jgi:hypothetical protein
MVFYLFTAADHRGLYFYSNSLGTELDRTKGNEPSFQRPSDKDQHQTCRLFLIRQNAPGRAAA